MKYLFDNDQQWRKFKAELLSWRGTPYRHLAHVKGRGADCTQFIAHAMFNVGLLKSVDYDYYPKDWHINTKREFVLESCEHHIKNNLASGIGAIDLSEDDVKAPGFLKRGDLVVYSTTAQNVSNHCAIVLDEFDGRCQVTIHSIEHRGVSRFPLGRTWKRKLTCGFRFTEK